MVKSGDSNIYMATHITAEPEIGELRYIARLSAEHYPDEYPFGVVSTTAQNSATIGKTMVLLIAHHVS
jgi:rhamnogalacturonan endolyase